MTQSVLSPIGQVKKSFESKEKLVDQLISKLKKRENESQEEFRKRLLQVSNTQLLRLGKKVFETKSKKKI